MLRAPQRSIVWLPAIYVGTALLFFWPAIITRQVPLPLENAYSLPHSLWTGHHPPTLGSPVNFTLGDLVNYYYPYMYAALPRLRHGQIPLWNPHIYGGMPFMAAHQPAVLYPLNLLFAAVGAQWIWVPTAIVRLFLMGWGLHLFMRRLGISDRAAVWSGISYQFCASGITWLHFGIHNVLAFLPLALYTTERLIATPRGRWFLLLTACLAAQFLGGHPETSTLFALVWGSWTCLRIPWRHPWLPLMVLGLAIVAAIGLTLPQLLPTVALVRASATLARRPHVALTGAWSNIRYWLLLINPYLFGTPVGGHYWSPTENYNEYAIYMGFLTLPLGIIGMVRSRPRPIITYWTGVALLSLGLRFPLPGLDRLYALRLLQIGTGIRFNFSWSLAAAVLAGFGVEAVLQGSRLSRVLIVGLTTVSLGLLLCSVYTLSHGQSGSWVLGGSPQRAALHQIAAFYQWHNTQLVWLVVLAAISWLLTTGLCSSRLRPMMPTLLLIISLADLLAHGTLYHSQAHAGAIYPLTTLSQALHTVGGQFRIAPVEGGIIEGNSSMTQNLDNALGDDDLVSLRYLHFANRSAIRRMGAVSIIQPLAQRFFDLANVEFVLSARPVTGTSGAAWKLWKQDGSIRIYRNPQVLPRAYAVANVRVVAPEQALDIVFAPTLDPRSVAVVEEPLPELSNNQQKYFLGHDRFHELSYESPVKRSVHPVLQASTWIASYQPEQVILDVKLSQPGLVVLSDSYAPGWRVTVDGTATHLYRTNAVFRGVFVAAGRHRVVFRYEPQDVYWGTVGAGITLVLCLLGCYEARRRRIDREGIKVVDC